MPNLLYYGDNLDVLRQYIPDESVDLIYLDPPFNSKTTYNILFAEATGGCSAAQIRAFEDTWHWGLDSEHAFQELVTEGRRRLGELMVALRAFLGQNDMMAYLTMMAIRLVELHRVLKWTGSLYLHCDPTASHYVKLLLDAVFGPRQFQSEIIWQRSMTHGGASKFNAVHDVIFYYVKGPRFCWNPQYQPLNDSYLKSHWRQVDDSGRRYQLIVAHGAGQGPPRRFGDREIPPPPGRHWAWNQETIDRLMAEGRIVFTRNGMPRYKVYLDERPGKPLTDVWIDIPPVNSQAAERLGYPTQKPESLLERIIRSSSNEGDVVLDPFCGCGTAISAAERLKRRWIGIDITHLAIGLIRRRLTDTFGAELSRYEVIGEPTDWAGANALAHQDRYQFQWWALGVLGARPTEPDQRKGKDRGIDGVLYFFDDNSGRPKRVILQVKSGHVSSRDVRDLVGVVDRERAAIGALITMKEPSRDMVAEAVAAGFYVWEPFEGGMQRYPRIQILTVEELIQGRRLELPPRYEHSYKRAERYHRTAEQLSLGLAGDGRKAVVR